MKKFLTLALAVLFAMAAMTASLAEAGMAEGADSDWYMDILADGAVTAEYPYHAFVDVNGDGVPVLLISTTQDSFITAEDKAIVYLYDNGAPKQVMEAGGGGGDIFYANTDEHTLTHFSRLSGESHIEVYHAVNGALELVTKLDTYQPNHGPNGDNAEPLCYQDDAEITQEAADELIALYATDNAITYEATEQAEEAAPDAQAESQDALDEALQALREVREEKALEALKAELDGYVAEGKLTREQADLIVGYFQEKPDKGQCDGWRMPDNRRARGNNRFGGSKKNGNWEFSWSFGWGAQGGQQFPGWQFPGWQQCPCD